MGVALAWRFCLYASASGARSRCTVCAADIYAYIHITINGVQVRYVYDTEGSGNEILV
jgi:hypothetical protein